MTKLRDLTGQRFGRYTVLERAEDYVNPWSGCRATQWRCLCDCGTIKVVVGESLKQGVTRSCGCLKRDMARERALNGVFKKA